MGSVASDVTVQPVIRVVDPRSFHARARNVAHATMQICQYVQSKMVKTLSCTKSENKKCTYNVLRSSRLMFYEVL